MKKALSLISLSVFFCSSIFAEIIDARAAAERIVNAKNTEFLTRSNYTVEKLKLAYTALSDDVEPVLYIFNKDNTGFVVAPADDRLIPVLGYSDCGIFDENNCPDGLKFLFDEYAKVIESLNHRVYSDETDKAGEITINTRALAPSIAPLLGDTKWNQGYPYNFFCPQYDGKNNSVTGCVATAMAQVMHYYKWPETSVGLKSYTTRTYNIKVSVPASGGRTYNWDKMKPTYTGQETSSAEFSAVANLMSDVGVSVNMDYGPESGAFSEDIPNALIKNFGYANTAQLIYRQNYTSAEWDACLKEELSNNRPIILSGQGKSGGHCFVCDGYDADNHYHFNWGWGGMSDGYFSINNLCPEEQGIGGNSGYGYNISLDAVIGIQVGDGHFTSPDPFIALASSTAYDGKQMWVEEKEDDSNTAIINALIYNLSDKTDSVDIAFVIEDTEGHLSLSSKDNPENCIIKPNVGYLFAWEIEKTNLTKKGTRIHFEKRRKDKAEWHVIPSYSGSNYLIATDDNISFVPDTKIVVKGIETADKIYAGLSTTISVSMFGIDEFYGQIRPYIVETDTYDDYKNVFVEKGSTDIVGFNVTLPAKVGAYSIQFETSDGSMLCFENQETATITVEAQEVSNGKIKLVVLDALAEYANGIINLKTTLKNDSEFSGSTPLSMIIAKNESEFVFGTYSSEFSLLPYEERKQTFSMNISELEDGEYTVYLSTGSTKLDVWRKRLEPGAKATKGNPSGLNDIIQDTKHRDNSVYDLNGRKLKDCNAKGLLISNGKIILLK